MKTEAIKISPSVPSKWNSCLGLYQIATSKAIRFLKSTWILPWILPALNRIIFLLWCHLQGKNCTKKITKVSKNVFLEEYHKICPRHDSLIYCTTWQGLTLLKTPSYLDHFSRNGQEMTKNKSCFYKFPQVFLFGGVSLVQTSSNNNNSYKAHVSKLVSRSLKSPGPFNNVCRN